ncbi:reverse transcriptase, partial [Globisporangium splendens]
MSEEEIRAASHSTAHVSQSSTDSWKLKLPFLCARPGNVGVQIDSYRTVTMFERPRCGKFTEHFLGIPYENSSMENYSRVLERTSKRARIVEERLAKLKAREQEIIEDDERRRQLRREREGKRQRKPWLHHQSRKKREQRQREEVAVIVIQCYVCGYFARRERDARREVRVQDHAARTLQRFSRSFLMRKQRERRALEQQKERQMQAATILQRQIRKRLAIAARQRLQKLEVPEPHHCPSLDAVQEDDAVDTSSSPVKSTQLDELDRHIGLDLLFSDDEEESPAPSSPYGNGLEVLTPPVSHSDPISSDAKLASPRAVYQPKRPVSIKRVGGGFRATSFSPTKPVVPTRAFNQQQQPRRPGAIPLTPSDTRGVYLLFFDGGSRGNPGPGGTGSIIVRVHKDSHTASLIWAASMVYSRKDTTNNFAEYWGLIHGLREAQRSHFEPLYVIGDSALIISQQRMHRSPRQHRLARLYQTSRRLADCIDIRGWYHHYRAFNKMADSAANLAVDTRTSTQVHFPTQRAAFNNLTQDIDNDVMHWLMRSSEDPRRLPSSSNHAVDQSTSKHFAPAPEHSLPFDDEAVLSQAPLPRPPAIPNGNNSSSGAAAIDDDDEHVLEELVEAYARSHVT